MFFYLSCECNEISSQDELGVYIYLFLNSFKVLKFSSEANLTLRITHGTIVVDANSGFHCNWFASVTSRVWEKSKEMKE